MNRVVLLAINAKYVHSSLSVWVIAEGVSLYSQKPHDVNVVEATINQKFEDIVSAVAELEPDVIGVSSYIWSAEMLPELLVLLRERLPGAVIVLGGPEASNNADYWLENGADYVLRGEGEYVFPQFLDTLEAKGRTQGDGSLAHAFSRSEASISEQHMCPVNPYNDSYFAALNGRLSYIETSRGCPFKCSFCLSAGSGVRYFPLDSVKEQILKLSLANTKMVKFVDRTFNCNAERAFEIFEFVVGLDTSCTFHFEVAADLFDERTLALLETAPHGRIQFEIGLQSFYEPALKATVRQTDLEKAEHNIRSLLKSQNIHVHVDLIAGLPYETLADFIKSFNRAYTLNAHNLQLGFLKLLHGSKLREQVDDFGIRYSPEPPYEILCNPWLSVEDVEALKFAENALQHTHNKRRFLSTLYYVLSVTEKTPFTLLHSLGTAVPSHATQLEDYIVQLFDFFVTLPGVDEFELKDCMIYDWLSMVKGKNTPAFLKNEDEHRAKLAAIAENTLGRKPRREEYAVLHSGKGIFVDSNNYNTVTGLYEVHICG